MAMIENYMAGSMHMITPCDWHEQASLLMPRNPDTQQREDSQGNVNILRAANSIALIIDWSLGVRGGVLCDDLELQASVCPVCCQKDS